MGPWGAQGPQGPLGPNGPPGAPYRKPTIAIKSFEDYLKMELVFSYDDEVDSKLTPEYEKKNKDKGIRKNIKKTMEKDKNFNEIMGGLKVESVKFNKKNET